MTNTYEGIVQQNPTDNFFETKHTHNEGDSNCAIVKHNLCVVDPNNAHGSAPFWYQGLVKRSGLYSKLKCSIIDFDVCNITGDASVHPDVFKPKWKNIVCDNPRATGLGSSGFAIPGAGEVSCDWPKDLFLQTSWIKAYTNGISSGGGQQSKIVTSGFGKDKNLDEMYSGYCSQIAKTQAVIESSSNTSLNTSTSLFAPLTQSNVNNSIPDVIIDPLLQSDQSIDNTLECPPDTINGGNISSCSYFKASSRLNTEGPQDLCSIWETKGNQGLVQGTIKSYCDINTTQDCLCLNPGIDPIVKEFFDALAETEEGVGLAASRSCWFKPCGSDSYLITGELEKEKLNCDKATKCSQVINIANSKGINLNNISQYLDCNINGPTPPNPNNSGTILGIPTEVFIIVVVIIVVIVLIILFYFFNGRKNSKSILK